MSNPPTLVFVPGAWHTPACYNKIIKILQEKHKLKCVAVTLPTTAGDPAATFKDDLDAARKAIYDETSCGRDVVVVAHSYGGMVGNSAIKDFARPRRKGAKSSSLASRSADAQNTTAGYVVGLILIASGYTFTGLAFMDPFFGRPPPTWRYNSATGFADIIVDPRQFFYHDLPKDEAEYWCSLLAPQSLRALYEGREYSYAGWLDVPSCYIGTIEDQGLPVALQRANVGMARGMGASAMHRELQTSHSPFLSQPQETVEVMVEAIEAFTGKPVEDIAPNKGKPNEIIVPESRLWRPITWFKFGLPLIFGRMIGKCVLVFLWGRRLFGFR
ncbi:Alpha/beta hydrolase family domain-containing protein [Trichoderma chlorosporum]